MSLMEERARRRAISVAFDLRPVAALRNRDHVVVLSDSHGEVLRSWRPPGWWFQVEVVGGATASGIVNPNSKTGAQGRFLRRLARVKPWQDVMAMLGEVDCGYVIWRHARATGLTGEQAAAETLDRYTGFLRQHVAPRGARTLVLSVPLPTLPDDSASWGEVAQKRSDVQVSQRDRTAMTLRFNEQLSERCGREGWGFVDATSGQFDPVTGLIRDDLVRHGSGDHHLVDAPFRVLIERALQGLAPAVH